eukprot:7422314-Pyramimonas_sp.AAC.1
MTCSRDRSLLSSALISLSIALARLQPKVELNRLAYVAFLASACTATPARLRLCGDVNTGVVKSVHSGLECSLYPMMSHASPAIL